jgi:hypothetical protein
LDIAEQFKPIALEMEIEAFKDRATTIRGSLLWIGILGILWLLGVLGQRRARSVFNR